MNNIENTLKKHGLAQDELPKVILNKIAHLQEIQQDLADTNEELKTEQDEETRKEMRATIVKAENYIEDLEEAIVETIEDYAERVAENGHDEPIRRAPIRRQQFQGQNPNQPAASQNTDNNTPKPKKSNALAWIVGGVVLVLTLGAVNTMSKQ